MSGINVTKAHSHTESGDVENVIVNNTVNVNQNNGALSLELSTDDGTLISDGTTGGYYALIDCSATVVSGQPNISVSVVMPYGYANTIHLTHQLYTREIGLNNNKDVFTPIAPTVNHAVGTTVNRALMVIKYYSQIFSSNTTQINNNALVGRPPFNDSDKAFPVYALNSTYFTSIHLHNGIVNSPKAKHYQYIRFKFATDVSGQNLKFKVNIANIVI